MQNPNVKFSIQSPISASKKSFVYDGLRVILCGFFGMILLSVTIYYTAKGGIFIRDMISDSRQTSVLREFYLYLCAEPDFMLPVDRSEQLTDEIHRNHLATTNPEVIKRAMQKLGRVHPKNDRK